MTVHIEKAPSGLNHGMPLGANEYAVMTARGPSRLVTYTTEEELIAGAFNSPAVNILGRKKLDVYDDLSDEYAQGLAYNHNAESWPPEKIARERLMQLQILKHTVEF